ncbi:MAG: CtsR family transcriptional regulator [Clostridia bacterium]|nr:CtsR family transcriptional regulator [Clostridia bacterium]
MGMSDRIEAFICELLREDDGWVEIGRNELAEFFGCVPSQINYVMSTRFTPSRGYIIESRRGGGGYLKIKKILPETYEILSAIGNRIDKENAKTVVLNLLSLGIIEKSTARILSNILALNTIDDGQRADILKSALSV